MLKTPPVNLRIVHVRLFKSPLNLIKKKFYSLLKKPKGKVSRFAGFRVITFASEEADPPSRHHALLALAKRP